MLGRRWVTQGEFSTFSYYLLPPRRYHLPFFVRSFGERFSGPQVNTRELLCPRLSVVPLKPVEVVVNWYSTLINFTTRDIFSQVGYSKGLKFLENKIIYDNRSTISVLFFYGCMCACWFTSVKRVDDDCSDDGWSSLNDSIGEKIISIRPPSCFTHCSNPFPGRLSTRLNESK